MSTYRFLTASLLLVALAGCHDAPSPAAPLDPPPVTAPPIAVAEPIDTVAARLAWTYVANTTQPATGLAKPIYPFQFATVWDLGSLLGATYSAHELRLISDSAYDARVQQILGTLGTVPLFEGAAFNRAYDVATGGMVDAGYHPSTVGFGWSATDIGRLLVWLRVLAVNQPRYAAQATRVVQRLDFSRIVGAGVLHGTGVDSVSRSVYAYDETGLGYEQYAAAGFALWGHRASSALDAAANVSRVDIYGVSVSVDTRDEGKLTSEPYILLGLETGWYSPELQDQAARVLAAQQARYASTGVLTMASEDALPVGPFYFYYYALYEAGQRFVVLDPERGNVVQQPRWMSTKAAFAWRALKPSSYTKAALAAVRGSAVAGQGWGAGVYEETGVPTGEPNINTAAVVLESLAYQQLGHSFLREPIH